VTGLVYCGCADRTAPCSSIAPSLFWLENIEPDSTGADDRRLMPSPSSRDAPPDQDRRRDLKLIVLDGMAWSILVGCGETYFAAFVLSLGMGEVAAGLVSSVPMVC
jgi:hypothetical protein